MSVRRAVARPEGSEDLMDDVRRYERSALADRSKAALRLADAFLAFPGGFTQEARADALAHFSPAAIVEIALKLVWWSSNKLPVTLGTDAPHDEHRLTSFDYADDGEYIVQPAAG
jgi:hypothetical protein